MAGQPAPPPESVPPLPEIAGPIGFETLISFWGVRIHRSPGPRWTIAIPTNCRSQCWASKPYKGESAFGFFGIKFQCNNFDPWLVVEPTHHSGIRFQARF